MNWEIEKRKREKKKKKRKRLNTTWADRPPPLFGPLRPSTAQPRSSISIPRALQLSRGPHRSVAWYRNCAIIAVWRAHTSAGVFRDLALASLPVEPTAQSHLPHSAHGGRRYLPCRESRPWLTRPSAPTSIRTRTVPCVIQLVNPPGAQAVRENEGHSDSASRRTAPSLDERERERGTERVVICRAGSGEGYRAQSVLSRTISSVGNIWRVNSAPELLPPPQLRPSSWSGLTTSRSAGMIPRRCPL
jgi:hypothetical protein